MSQLKIPSKRQPDRESFVAFMTLFGRAQEELRDLMRGAPGPAAGLGPMQMRALCICVENPGAAQSHLAKAMGRDKGQIARMAKELEERGLLAREPDARDKRSCRLTATASGIERSRWFESLEEAVAGRMFAGVGLEARDGLSAALALMESGLAGEGA